MDLSDVFKAPAPKKRQATLDGLPQQKLQRTSLDDADDDEDRFFADGLSDDQRNVLQLLEMAEDVEIPTLDLSALKKLILRFERAITKNQELRVRFADDPIKFLDSEVDLDAQIHAMAALATAPQLYAHTAQSGVATSLLELLQHENLDIVMTTIELLDELTDEAVLNPNEDDISLEILNSIKAFVNQLCNESLIELLYNTSLRFDITAVDDRSAIFKILSIIENVISLDNNVYASQLITRAPQFIKFMLTRIEETTKTAKKSRQANIDEIASYCAELITVLAQSCDEAKEEIGRQGGMDILLQTLSIYKRRDPFDDDETEFMENIFDSLCTSLGHEPIKRLFREAEGFELMFLMIKGHKLSRIRAIRVCNHALAGISSESVLNATYFVEHLGLKTIFPLFMHMDVKRMQKQYKDHYHNSYDDDEHILSILVSLLRNLQGNVFNELRQRVLYKFNELNDQQCMEKVDCLINQIFWVYFNKTRTITDSLVKQLKNAEEEDIEYLNENMYIQRLAAGGFTLSMSAVLLAELMNESNSVREYIQQTHRQKNPEMEHTDQDVKLVDAVKEVLTEYVTEVGDKLTKTHIQTLLESLSLI